MQVPAWIQEAARRAILDPSISELDKARALAGHLMPHVKDKGPIQRTDVEDTYLWEGNNVVSRGRANALITAVSRVSQPGAELAAIVTGHFPRIVPLPTSTNAVHLERMSSLRERLLLAATIGSLLALLLVVLMVAHLGRRRVERTCVVSH